MKAIQGITLSLATLLMLPLGGSVRPGHTSGTSPAFLKDPSPWADSVLASLSLEERIAQLMMVAAWSNKDEKHHAELEALIRTYDIGGLIFFQGGPLRQQALTSRYQRAAKTPLLIGMDLEWGLNMRLDSTMYFPRQMTLGAVRNDSLITAMGLAIAAQMKALGVHVSFSPVADVNSDPRNPVINERSFGEDREQVAMKAIAYMKGLQEGGVIATGKHFPGHGDTDTDSHKTLPLILQDRSRLDSLELYPFRKLIAAGVQAMMVAHLEVPALDSTAGQPSTLSRAIVSDLLKRELGFRGLIFTDALNMGGVAEAERPGDIELRAIQAGNDVLLFPLDPVRAIERIVEAVQNGDIDESQIDARCLKVLRAKEWAGLNKLARHTKGGNDLLNALHTSGARSTQQELYAQAITLVKNDKDLVPLRSPLSRIVLLTIDDEPEAGFLDALHRYADVTEYRVKQRPSDADIGRLMKQFGPSDLVIAALQGVKRSPSSDFGVEDQALKLIRQINVKSDVILVHFGNPYRLRENTGVQEMDALVVAYEDVPETHDKVAQLIFGGQAVHARLPVTASIYLPVGEGAVVQKATRLGHALPEQEGMNSAVLQEIDSIVLDGIRGKAYPGCQLLVARNGRIVLDKNYGKPIYQGDALTSDHVYDLASITKIAATTITLMKLVDEGKFDLDRTIGHYLPEIPDTNAFAQARIRDVLTHQAGFPAWIPFYTKMLENGKRRPDLFSERRNNDHPVKVAERVYIPQLYQDSILHWIIKQPLKPRGEYKYSDIGYYLLQRAIQHITGQPLDTYVQENFYIPLGLRKFGYHPREWTDRDHIVPTEFDGSFREQQVWGDVHDPGAAMMGGVGGHAGLFGNAHDLAVIMQLLLNGGEYGGVRYIDQATVDEFTRCQFCVEKSAHVQHGTSTDEEDQRQEKVDEIKNGAHIKNSTATKPANRRGLGFDKPVIDGEGGPTCQCVSLTSFGHTGFTGTIAWADPQEQLIYIFLSNRIYPTSANKKLLDMNIRTEIQEVIYRSLPPRPQQVVPDKVTVPVIGPAGDQEPRNKRKRRR